MLFSKSVTPNYLKSSLKPKSRKVVLGSVIRENKLVEFFEKKGPSALIRGHTKLEGMG